MPEARNVTVALDDGALAELSPLSSADVLPLTCLFMLDSRQQRWTPKQFRDWIRLQRGASALLWLAISKRKPTLPRDAARKLVSLIGYQRAMLLVKSSTGRAAFEHLVDEAARFGGQ